jgi:outer membrane protein assembly factor BamB
MRNRRLAMVAAALAIGMVLGAHGRTAGAGGSAAAPATQANPGVGPTPEMALDEETLAKARARGRAMLDKARWETPWGLGAPLLDAGDVVISAPVSSVPGAVRAADKATGKEPWPRMMVAVKAVSAKGDAMVVERLAGPLQEADTQAARGTSRLPSSTQLATGEGLVMEMMRVADRASLWQVPWEPYADSVLLAPQQVFTGALAPRETARSIREVPPLARNAPLEVRAFDRATGKKQWSYLLPAGTIYTRTLTFADGVLYVVAVAFEDPLKGSSTLIALNAADGKPVFTWPMQEGNMSPVAVTNGVAMVATALGEVVGLDSKTGKEEWRERIWLSKEPGRATLVTQWDLDEAPVFAGDVLLVPVRGTVDPAASLGVDNRRGGLAAFDIKTRQQLWFFRPPEDTGPAVRPGAGTNAELTADTTVLALAGQLCLRGVQVEKGEIVALAEGSYAAYVGVDLKIGKLDWLLPTSIVMPGRRVTKPLVSNGMLYIANDGTRANAKLLAVPLEAGK